MSKSKALARQQKPRPSLALYKEGGANPFSGGAAKRGAQNEKGFLRFSGNDGKWTHKDDVLPDETLLVFNLYEAQRGYIGWSNGKPLKKELWKIKDLADGDIPSIDTMEPIPIVKKNLDGWREVVIVQVRDTDAEFPQMELSLPAGDGWRPIERLLLKFGNEISMNWDEDAGLPMVPIIKIGSDSFETDGGTKYAPVLKLEDWLTHEELEKIAALAATNLGEEAASDDDDEDDDVEDEDDDIEDADVMDEEDEDDDDDEDEEDEKPARRSSKSKKPSQSGSYRDGRRGRRTA